MRIKYALKLMAAAGCSALTVLGLAYTLKYVPPHEEDSIPPKAWQGFEHLEEAAVSVFSREGIKAIALTFDDGPNKAHTAPLLDVLIENDVRATFFVLGMNAKKNGELIKRMSDEGHQIGNHGYDHTSFTKLSSSQIKEQVEKTSDLVEKFTGTRPTLTRPPHGAQNERVKEAVNMPMILWSVDPRDWNTTSSKKVYEHVVKHAQPGDIILLHDISRSTVEAVKEIIPTLKKKGYTFVTVEELLISVYGEVDDFTYFTAEKGRSNNAQISD